MGTPFITVQNLSDKLGRDVTADAGAQFAVEAACSLIRDLTNQSFAAGTSVVSFDGTGTDVLMLPQHPVTAVGTVVVDGGTVTDYVPNYRNGALLRGTAGRAGFTNWRPCWPRGRQNVTVTYEHGFETIPMSLQLVALTIAERLVVQGVASAEVIGDAQITYAAGEADLTAGELRVINGHKRPQSF